MDTVYKCEDFILLSDEHKAILEEKVNKKIQSLISKYNKILKISYTEDNVSVKIMYRHRWRKIEKVYIPVYR